MLFYTNVFTRGNYIYFRGIKNGKRIQQKVPFQPSLFIKSKNKESKYKSLQGESLEKIKFDSITESRDFIQRYKEVANFPIFGNYNYNYQFISKLFPKVIEFDMSQMKIVTIDIETSTEFGFPDTRNPQEEIILITLQDFNTKRLTTFGCKPYTVKKENSEYILCNNETELLREFITHLKSDYPDVITGWNSQLFDIAYISARIIQVLGNKALSECSPWGLFRQYEVTTARGRTQPAYEWLGISILDFMDLYKKFSYKMVENYKLDTVAKEELNEEKIKAPYATFKEFYTNDWNTFCDYNIHDVVLVDSLEDKLKIINLILTMAYDAKCNYIDIFSSVRTWDCIIYNYLLKDNIIIHNPPPISPEADRSIMGAFVKEPIPKGYDWVVSFDATSLYPSIIMAWNMSSETLVDGRKYLDNDEKSIQKLIDRDIDTSYLVEQEYNMAANGQCFYRSKKGIFPQLIEYYFGERQKAKKKMLAAEREVGDIKEEMDRRGINYDK